MRTLTVLLALALGLFGAGTCFAAPKAISSTTCELRSLWTVVPQKYEPRHAGGVRMR
jgi:hypothetical protein